MSRDSPKDEQLQQARDLVKASKVADAIRLLNDLLSDRSYYVDALLELADLHLSGREFVQAADLLSRAAIFEPAHKGILERLGKTYQQLKAYDLAEDTFHKLIDLSPESAKAYYNLGQLHRQSKDYDKAVTAYKRALEIQPDLGDAALYLGRCYNEMGNAGDAFSAYEIAFKCSGRRLLPIVMSMSQLPYSLTQHVLSERFDEAYAKLANKEDEENKITTSFISARMLHAQGRYAEAWQLACKVNGRVHTHLQERLKKNEKFRARETGRVNQLKKKRPEPLTDKNLGITSLFILGPSGSGKTTIERLLHCAESGVKRGYESELVGHTVRRVNLTTGRKESTSFTELPQSYYPEFTRYYVQSLKRLADDHRIFTITTPALIHHIARLVLTVPNAKFIFVKRNIYDVALSILFSYYSRHNAYAYSIKGIFNYLEWYFQMMDSYAEIFPDIIMTVEDTENEESQEKTWQALIEFSGSDKPVPENFAIESSNNISAPYRTMMDALLSDGTKNNAGK